MANRQLSLRERTKSALERITQIEENYEQLGQALERELRGMMNRLSSLEETMAAVAKSVGREVVDAIIEETRRDEKTRQATMAKEEITKLVEAKTLVAAEVVGEDSFIVGHDVDAEGNVVHPGFGHVHFKQVDPKHQEKVKGASAGVVIPTGAEGTKQGFVIDQIYTFVPPKPPEATPEAEAVRSAHSEVIAELGDAEAVAELGVPEGTVLS